MQVISETIDFNIPEDTVVAIGKFDGIHKGHGEIFRHMFEYKKQGLKTAILTFDISPSSVFMKKDNSVLTTNAEKRYVFEQLGIDYVCEFPFNEKTAGIEASDFIEDFLISRMKMKAVVVGTDCRFGCRGLGNSDLLRKYSQIYDYELVVVDKLIHGDKEVSSTYVRECVEAGKISLANEMLMYPYFFLGRVEHGNKLGRTIGMPTVNLIPEANKLAPPNGVYYSKVNYGGEVYRAITNVGFKPTVSEGDKEGGPVLGVETYLYDFDKQIYGETILVSLFEYIRPERRFDSFEELCDQIQKDAKEGKNWHKNHS